MNYCGNIYRYAVATGRAERDISSDLRGALPPSTPQHHASVTDPEGVAALLRAIDGYRGSNVTRYALHLAPLVFVRPRKDLPVGAIAMVADPMGTPFYVMTPILPPGNPDARSDVFDVTTAQHVRWNELASPDRPRAKQFYAKHFGFELKDSMPMGAMGSYEFIDHAGLRLGAIMRKPPQSSNAAWLFYFGVHSITAAKAAIEKGGGKVMNGPHQVPGGDWVVIAVDPQGAAFGAVGPEGA
jgi:predicted enzyme related to lactoylglutathione lyase